MCRRLLEAVWYWRYRREGRALVRHAEQEYWEAVRAFDYARTRADQANRLRGVA